MARRRSALAAVSRKPGAWPSCCVQPSRTFTISSLRPADAFVLRREPPVRPLESEHDCANRIILESVIFVDVVKFPCGVVRLIFVLALCTAAQAQSKKTYVVVQPGTHPGIIFSEEEL